VRETGSGIARKTAIENARIRETRTGAARTREVANLGTRGTRPGAAAVRSRVQSGRAFRRCGSLAARRTRDGSRRTQRQVVTIRIWTIADCGEANFRRGSRPMSRGAQCEVEPGVNKTSQVTNSRGQGSRMNAQTPVPVGGSEKANNASTSIRLKAECARDIASNFQPGSHEPNEHAIRRSRVRGSEKTNGANSSRRRRIRREQTMANSGQSELDEIHRRASGRKRVRSGPRTDDTAVATTYESGREKPSAALTDTVPRLDEYENARTRLRGNGTIGGAPATNRGR
jgi:hypothetical protein